MEINGFLIIVISLIPASNAKCSPTSTGIKRYGTDCKYICHCINNEQCDAVTGYCTSGCDFEWVGPGCQFKNIAFKKASRHIDNINPPMYSNLANDDDVSTCSFTDTAAAATRRTVAPWWTLWLPSYAPFRKLVFVSRENHLPYFPNFKLIVQNVSKSDFEWKKYSTDGVLCYQHDASIPRETTVQVSCIGVPIGNLIRLQLANTSTQLVICDFRVYEVCDNGFYGSNCSEQCSSTCYPAGQFTCDNIEGKCLNGCVAGWKGTRCENECERGNWGIDCAGTCGNCFSATCSNTNGHCPNGCDAGFKQTDLCIEKCSNGYYGKDCTDECSSTCARSSGSVICNNVNGRCLEGCMAGWKGLQCKSKCEEGNWGIKCASTCGNCFSKTCNHVNGVCPGGCAVGFKPTSLCTEKCNNGYYGKDCKRICSRTCSRSGSVICDNVDGKCSNGCKDGWEGIWCENECEHGKWGRDCAETCGNCFSATCNNTNGHCPNGCDAGFKQTDLCIEKCSNDYYGKDCKHECSSTCFRFSGSAICDNVDGSCLEGCTAGWKGLQCKSKCENGKWGIGCAGNCGNCYSTTCNNVNGTCPDGCAVGFKPTGRCTEKCNNGFYGKDCKHNCSRTCSLSGSAICDNVNGSCSNGCKDGWEGIQCGKKCEEGKWGNGCANKCGNCSLTTCNNENGGCPKGCAGGFKSTKFCDQECDNGTYGVNCSSTCSANCNSVCDKVKGTCLSCKAGWKGTNCKSECEPGKWGINCTEDCGKCENDTACNRSNGTCFGGGCMPGYKLTERCDEECDVGKYGVACKHKCSESCAEICSIIDGKCGRCHAGWTGDLCALRCREGTWGENCMRVCGKCISSSCDVLSGACNGGNCQPGYKYKLYCDEECENGWYGNNCSRKCNTECKDVSLCRKSDGICLTETVSTNGETRTTASSTTAVIAGVGAAIIVVIILGVLSILFYMRRTHHSTTVSNEGKGPKAIYVNSAEPVDSAYDTIQGRNLNEHEYGTA